MSTCQMTDWVEFCNQFDQELKRNIKNKDVAIDRYSNLILEGEKCLDVIKELPGKEHLCQKLAIGYNERGLVKYHKVDFDDAIDDFTKALSYDNSLHTTFYNRGLIHYRLDMQSNKCQNMWALINNPNDGAATGQDLHFLDMSEGPLSYDTGHISKQLLANLPLAISCYLYEDDIFSTLPDFMEAREFGRYNEAIADMKNSLKLKPDFESAQRCLQQAQTDKLNST